MYLFWIEIAIYLYFLVKIYSYNSNGHQGRKIGLENVCYYFFGEAHLFAESQWTHNSTNGTTNNSMLIIS